MLLTLASQVSAQLCIWLLLYTLIAYVVVQLIQQKSIVTFLGYKTLLLICVGWGLVAQNMDILALILWIVYGSFIVVMFIFSFLWLDTRHPLRLLNYSPMLLSTLLFSSSFVLVFLTTVPHIPTASLFYVHWINHYELLHLHNSEEIEALGWALSTDLMLPTVFTSLLLTIACITAIVVILTAKKHKWLITIRLLHLHGQTTPVITTSVRRQIIFQQEARELFKLNRVFSHSHSRRA